MRADTDSFVIARTLQVLPVAEDVVGRAGLTALVLQSGRSFSVVHATSRRGIAAALGGQRIDVLVWEPGLDGAGALDVLGTHVSSWPPVVMLVADAVQAREALQAGARGVLSRDTSPMVLGAALESAAVGMAVVDPVWLSALVPSRISAGTPPVEPLTAREREVLALMAEGMSNRDIAARLGVTEHTAKFHVNAVMAKLGVQKRTEAVTRAVRLGLVVL